MSIENSANRKRWTSDLENNLVYFANRQNKTVSREEAAQISHRVMANLDVDNPIIGHKGMSWLAREIVTNRD